MHVTVLVSGITATKTTTTITKLVYMNLNAFDSRTRKYTCLRLFHSGGSLQWHWNESARAHTLHHAPQNVFLYFRIICILRKRAHFYRDNFGIFKRRNLHCDCSRENICSIFKLVPIHSTVPKASLTAVSKCQLQLHSVTLVESGYQERGLDDIPAHCKCSHIQIQVSLTKSLPAFGLWHFFSEYKPLLDH